MIYSEDIAAVLLNGGEARRLGGIKKFLIEIDGKKVIEHQMEVLRENFSDILIVGKYDEIFRKFPVNVIEDLKKGVGPIGGIFTALKSCNQKRGIFVFGCDMPFLNDELIKKEIERYYDSNPDVLISCDEKGLIHPLHSIYSINTMPNFESFMNKGIYSIKEILKENLKIEKFIVPEKYRPSLTNINTIDDIESVKKIPY